MSIITKNNKVLDDRSLLQLWKKLRFLYKLQKQSPQLQLQQPIRKGYARSYQIRTDLISTPLAQDLAELLPLLNSEKICDNISFTTTIGNNKVPIPQQLNKLKKAQYEALAAHLKPYFEPKHQPNTNGEIELIFEFKYPYYFSFFYKPYYITSVKVVNQAVIELIYKIEQFLTYNNLWSRLQHLLGWRSKSFRIEHKTYQYNPKLSSAEQWQDKELLDLALLEYSVTMM